MAIIPMYQEDYYKIYPEDKPKNIKRNKLKSSR